jgi:hypothetical protein
MRTREDLRNPYIPLTSVRFVDSNHPFASDANSGKNAEMPKATMQAALDSLDSGSGTAVLLAAGHVETATADFSWPTGAKGCAVIGMGEGRNRARIVGDGGIVRVDQDNVLIQNIELRVSSGTLVLSVTGDNCSVVGVHSSNSEAGASSIVGILSVSGDDCEVRDVHLNESGLNTSLFFAGIGHRMLITDCSFTGNSSIAVVATTNGVGTDTVIARSDIRNSHATGLGLDFNDTGTGVICWNNVSGTAAVATLIDPGDARGEVAPQLVDEAVRPVRERHPPVAVRRIAADDVILLL